MVSKDAYPLTFKVIFWLLWLLGIGSVVLFGGFLFLTAMDVSLVAGWNALVVLTELFLLYKTATHFFSADKPVSEQLLWVTFAALGIPLLATGGCFIVDSLGQGLRFAG